MNYIFYLLALLATIAAGFLGTADETGRAALDASRSSVELALGLVGYMALFLGLMKIVERAGGLAAMARMVRPVLVRLFPGVPPDHPAMGAMVMNISANALGLGNAATPFGLKAMKELQSLNLNPKVATNAMVLFLAINTSGLALLPTGMIGLRALHGSANPAGILPTTLIATAASTLVGVLMARWAAGWRLFSTEDEYKPEVSAGGGGWREFLPLMGFSAVLISLVVSVVVWGTAASAWIMPGLIIGMLTLGVVRKVPVYETFIEGAREGFDLAVKIIPFLLAILVVVGMFRASGGLDIVTGILAPVTNLIGMPAEALPVALIRPLSGAGAFAIVAELVETHGPDSVIGWIVTTMNGSTDTTFYILAVYFGSVGVTRFRHSVVAGLAADLTGVLVSVSAVHWLILS